MFKYIRAIRYGYRKMKLLHKILREGVRAAHRREWTRAANLIDRYERVRTKM